MAQASPACSHVGNAAAVCVSGGSRVAPTAALTSQVLFTLNESVDLSAAPAAVDSGDAAASAANVRKVRESMRGQWRQSGDRRCHRARRGREVVGWSDSDGAHFGFSAACGSR